MQKNLGYLRQIYQAFQIIRYSEWLKSSLVLGMAFMGLFVALLLLGSSLVQFFGGVTPYLVDIFPDSYLALQKIDKSFGGSNTTGLLLFFFPIVLVMSCYVLYLLEDFLDNILGHLQKPSLLKRASLYWVLLALVPIPYFGSWIYSIFTIIVEIDYEAFMIIPYLLPLIILVISICSYAVTYKILSKEIFPWKTSFKAGIIVGILFEIFKYFFIYLFREYIDLSTTSIIVIGFMLFSIWFCINGAIYALGVRIGFYIEFEHVLNPKKRKILGLSERRSAREIALICLLELMKRIYKTEDVGDYNKIGMDIEEICEFCMITPKRAKNVINHLSTVKLIRILYDNGKELVVLNFSPETLYLKKFIYIIEERKENCEMNNLPNGHASCWFWNKYQDSLESTFGDKTMKDLYEIQLKTKN